jgi:hypothetical protein
MWPFADRPVKEAVEKKTNLVSYSTDIEDGVVTETHLMNNNVKNFTWKGITVTVNDSKTGAPKVILDNIDGLVQAGMTTSTSKRVITDGV